MWIITKKKHEYVLGLARRQKKAMRESFEGQISDWTTKLQEAEKVLHSTEREKVLVDLEEALNLVQAYQRALDTLSAADPNIGRANDLLRRWDKEPESKTYLGVRTHADWNEKMGEPSLQVKAFMGPSAEAIDRWKREEEEYGDEAYGSGN